MSERPVRTVFLGSGAFAVPVLEALAGRPEVSLDGVVTAPPRPAGRRQALTATPVGQAASARGLLTLTPSRLRDPAALAELAALHPELVVLADYGQIVPPALLDMPRHGALNLHPSLLPRHRGATPVPAAILAGDERTGVTLMLMDAGLDSGPIVAQRSVALRGTETTPELEERLATLAAEVMATELPRWLAGSASARAQPADGVTLTRPLRRADGRLDPARPAVVLERQVRAYQPWPGSFLEAAGDRLVVWRARLSDEPAAPGTLSASSDGRLVLGTTAGSLELLEVQPAGGRRMSGGELLRGRPALVGAEVSRASDAPSGG